jgi:hypothetical protein
MGVSKPNKREKKIPWTESDRALAALGCAMGVGLLGILVFCLQISGYEKIVSAAGIGVMVAGASTLIGVLLGFLFGIPRTLQHTSNSAQRQDTDGEQTQPASIIKKRTEYGPNTNLEQISDWLTKILVGVGLTQVKEIREVLSDVADGVKFGVPDTGVSQAFALSLVLFYLICGFLFGFLWTRLYLPGAYKETDDALDALRKEVKEDKLDLQSKLSDVEDIAQGAKAAVRLGVGKRFDGRKTMPTVGVTQCCLPCQ